MPEIQEKYNKRTWLNPEISHFTGAVVCHDGVVSNQGKPPERYAFLEISSCHDKIRLHTDKNSGDEHRQIMDFILKLDLLEKEIFKFKTHLLRTLKVEEK